MTDYDHRCEGCPYEYAQHLDLEAKSWRSRPLAKDAGSPTARVLLIFQSPGVEEWKSGRPVSSEKPRSVGVRLQAAFGRVGRSRDDYHITNAVQCFPGKRQDRSHAPRDETPRAAARSACAQRLREDIEAKSYDRILVFGALARQSIDRLFPEARPDNLCCLRHPSGGLKNVDLDNALRY